MLFSEVGVYIRNFKSRGKIVNYLNRGGDKMKRAAIVFAKLLKVSFVLLDHDCLSQVSRKMK